MQEFINDVFCFICILILLFYLQNVELEVQSLLPNVDIIVFKVLTDLSLRRSCELELDPGATVIGKPYLLCGLSSSYDVDSSGIRNFTWVPGSITTLLTHQYVIKGSSGYVPGDLGGLVFSPRSKKLLGINVAMASLPASISASEAVYMRASGECLFVPTWLIHILLGSNMLVVGGGPISRNAIASPIYTTSYDENGVLQQIIAPPNFIFC